MSAPLARRSFALLVFLMLATAVTFAAAGGPALAQRDPRPPEVLEYGFSWFKGGIFSDGAVTFAIVVRNTDEDLVVTTDVSWRFLDTSGDVVMKDSDGVILMPSQTTIVADISDSLPATRMEVETGGTYGYTRAEWENMGRPVGTFEVSEVSTTKDAYDDLITRAKATSNFDRDVPDAHASVAYRDAQGKIIGGQSTFVDWIRREGTSEIEIEGYGVAPSLTVASSEVAARLSFLSIDRMGKAPPRVESGFRPAGKLVPELTTHIPTPLDVSTDPKVVFANLLIAAIATVLFTIALRVLNVTLAGHEGRLQQAIPPARWLAGAQQRADRLVASRAGRRADVVRILGILLFYGIVFSLLEPGWRPLTITGLALLVYMAVAFGAVGIVDDLVQFRAAKRWGLPAQLAVRPALAFLAVSSTVATRLFGIVPGIMIGTPDAFPLSKETLGEDHQRRLLKIGALALLSTGVGAWILSIGTNLAQRATLPGWAATAISGVEAFLLVVFAVTVQNVFMQMLALPGSIGAEIQRRSKLLWFGLFGVVTFVFLHTLLNPAGNVADALSETNVLFFLGTVIVFVLVSFAVWLWFRRAERRRGPRAEVQPVGVLGLEPELAPAGAAAPLPAAAPLESPLAQPVPAVVSSPPTAQPLPPERIEAGGLPPIPTTVEKEPSTSQLPPPPVMRTPGPWAPPSWTDPRFAAQPWGQQPPAPSPPRKRAFRVVALLAIFVIAIGAGAAVLVMRNDPKDDGSRGALLGKIGAANASAPDPRSYLTTEDLIVALWNELPCTVQSREVVKHSPHTVEFAGMIHQEATCISADGSLTIFVQTAGPTRYTNQFASRFLSTAADSVLLGPNWYVVQPGDPGSSADMELLMKVQQVIGGKIRTSL